MNAPENVAPKPTPRSWGAVALCIVAAAMLTAADLGTKAWAVENLSRGRFGDPPAVCTPDASGYIPTHRVPTRPKVVVENFFEFRYAENCGAAFGFLNDTNSVWKKVLFYGAALGAVVALLWSFREGRGGRWFVVAVPAIISGAIGNFSDRIRLGYVVDFVRFYVRQWEYPTFNVADVAITVGVIALLIDGILEERIERKRAAAEREAQSTPSEQQDSSVETTASESAAPTSSDSTEDAESAGAAPVHAPDSTGA